MVVGGLGTVAVFAMVMFFVGKHDRRQVLLPQMDTRTIVWVTISITYENDQGT
jgi:hypothetical protein